MAHDLGQIVSQVLTLLKLVGNHNSISFSADTLNIDADIYLVSSGPIEWDYEGEGGGSRFRSVFVLSEVSLTLYVQKIQYGPENCCAKVVKTVEIDAEKIAGSHKLFDATDIKWIKYDSFRFKGNSSYYTIVNLDGKYEVQYK
jgi:hypothetical protein